MGFADWLAGDLVVAAIVLMWAKWSALDLGLRAPLVRGAWPWAALYVAWYAAEWVVLSFFPAEQDPEWLEQFRQLPWLQQFVLLVVTGPVLEELLFRGAMFSALLRRWGIRTAAIAPSVLWGLLHFDYGPWFIASVAGSGVVLAILRWKSGSLYPSLCLHAAGNFLVLLAPYVWFPGTG